MAEWTPELVISAALDEFVDPDDMDEATNRILNMLWDICHDEPGLGDRVLTDHTRGLIVARTDPVLAERFVGLIEWLDLIDRFAEMQGRPDLASTVMQDDICRVVEILGGSDRQEPT